MSQENVNCNSCGAALSVTTHVNFVTCSRCNTPLAIRRTSSGTYTERAETTSDVTATPGRPALAPRLSDQPALAALQQQTELNRLENELNRLNLEWESEKERYMISGRYGHRYLPEKGSSVGGGCMIAAFGSLWVIFAFGITTGFTWSLDGDDFGPPPIIRILFPMFGVLFVIFGVMSSMRAYNKAEEYERAYDAYQSQHSELLDKIAKVRRGS